MRIYMIGESDITLGQGLEKVCTLNGEKDVYIDAVTVRLQLELENGVSVYLFGDIFYHIKNGGVIKFLDNESGEYLAKVFSQMELTDIIASLEGQYVGLLVDKVRGTAQIFGDKYARVDTFYAEDNGNFYLATDLDTIFDNVTPAYDQQMFAHMFAVYGWYTPKGKTIYKNVSQMRVGEIISLSADGMRSETIKFKPCNIREYSDRELEDYYTILTESVVARANRKGKKWVSSSSGWDSSMVLGILVKEFGADKVGMLTGRMKYSDKTEAINKFEIDKIKKIGEYYGIKPVIVDFDFKNKTAANYWQKKLPFYKSKHTYCYASFNFSKLSDGFCDADGEGQVVFNGEASDSFHNFGFSQFGTFFHTEKVFTEYADKMNCYLYGPSFFKKVLDGSYTRDKVFQIFSKMTGAVDGSPMTGSKEDLLQSYLFPFFYGSPRIPFAKTYENPIFTDKGCRDLYSFPFREYAPEVLSTLTDKNLYSQLIHLYHSFHAQGSTAGIHKHSMEMNGHLCRSPFNDYRVIDLLSQAPESWGRGLEFNNTKYPLKWVARNKIKFPYELLDMGPHSYLYDVIEGFSLFAEITYRSGVTEFFKNILSERPYKKIITDDFFDIKYLDALVSDYLDGKEAGGKDFSNLVSLITLCTTGWY